MNLEQTVLPFADIHNISWLRLVLLLAIYVAVRSLFLQGGFFLWLRAKGDTIRRRVYRVPFGPGQIRKEIRASLLIIVFDAIFIASVAKYGPAPARGHFVTTVLIGFVWFEIWFYASHRLLHHPSLYFIHKQHHTAKVTSPWTALSFSILERFIILMGGIGGIALLGLWYPISTLGLAFYLFLNYLLNLFAHSNIDIIPPRWQNYQLGRFLNAPTYHALHHSRYKGHYGLFTPYLDRILGTRFTDYETVQARAFRGEGLSSLSQRLTEGAGPRSSNSRSASAAAEFSSRS